MKLEIDNIVWPALGEISEQEQEIWLPPPRPGILEHTRATFILPEKTSRISGPWSDDYVPFMRRPLELLEHPPVRVWVSACTQGGKSTLASAFLNYIATAAPGPTGIVLPQEGLARDRIRTKWRPLFAKNAALLRKIGGDIRNLNINDPTDLGDMILYLCWASSIATMSDRSIQNMIYDEVVLFQILESSGESPIEYGRNRQRTFESIARELGISSPGDVGDLHDEQMRDGSDEVWQVPCPKKGCGKWHELQTYVDKEDQKYIVVDRPAPGKFYPWKDYVNDPTLSRYVCPHCGKAWTDGDRWNANREGRYISRHRKPGEDWKLSEPQQSMDENGTVTGPPPQGPQYSFTWHAMMLYPPFARVGAEAGYFASAWAKKEAGDFSKLRSWQRNHRARPWKETAIEVSEEELARRILPNLERATVPSEAKLLVGVGDYHMDEHRNVRIDWLVDAFGLDMANWTIAAGSGHSWEDFEEAMFRKFPWQDPEKKEEPLIISRCGVDSGYETDEVYVWTGQFIGWAWPIKGIEHQDSPIFYTDLEQVHRERQRKGKRRMRSAALRGQDLMKVDQNVFSTMVMRWATNPEGQAGQTYYYKQILEDTEGRFFKEFTAMKKSRIKVKNKWRYVWLPDGAVHFHDLKRYAAAMAWSISPRLLRSEMRREDLPPAMIGRPAAPRRPERIDRKTERPVRTHY